MNKCFAETRTNAPPAIFLTTSNDHVFLSKLCHPERSDTSTTRNIVVLKFMSIQCAPCKKELPSFLSTATWAEKLAQKNKKHIKFFIVNTDPLRKKADILEFMNAMKVDVDKNLLLDPYQRGAKAFNVRTIPQTFVINEDGLIVSHQSIFKPETYTKFKADIQSLIEKD